MKQLLSPIIRMAGAWLLSVATVTAAGPGHAAADDHPAIKRPFKLPPAAELNYAVKARHSGLRVNGESLVKWQTDGKAYSIGIGTRAGLLGKIVASGSEGSIDGYGLAPATATEKRFRKKPTTATFDRDSKIIRFSDSTASYPLLGGEQDRTSITWQLIGNARAAGKKFVAGSQWRYFVAGRADAEAWTFVVGKSEQVATPLGTVSAVHVTRRLPAGSRQQQLDLWLAPSLDWYPVKLLFAEPDGNVIEEILERIDRK